MTDRNINSKSQNPVEDYRNIQKEVRAWEAHLNDNIGNFSFAFAVASIGTNQPQFWALLSLIFAMLVHFPKRRELTKTLHELENKKNKTEYDNFLLKEYRSSISVKRTLPFTFGFLTLTIIILAPSLLPFPEAMNFLYGGKPYFDTLNFIIIHPAKTS
ncbi:hypothetical protein [Pseudomonas sp. PDM13]|uniref:hypothetical protein n=1 Tax=Pseudomonas sp. PDM13 TaxID=2769255 RepID=UPI0021DFEF61|nr:hypothetical protein [Pseudomonas sp. PDM13]MCU9951554.1 hypothetical protein [Pseudomonas sp. PDM13]